MTAARIGFWLGPLLFAASLLLPAPGGMAGPAWHTAGLVGWMATWWMTQAVPLSVTALLPFAAVPFFGGGTAKEVAADYYSPIIFLLLGGAFLALAIERTGLHRRLAAGILDRIGGRGGEFGLLLGFMAAAALLSNIISNTSTALIMMPMVLAVLAGAASDPEQGPRTEGLFGALPMGLAFAASIGGLGTIIGSPTNAIGVGVVQDISGVEISFAIWAMYGMPVVLLGVPLAAWIVARVHRVADHPFDMAAARKAIQPAGAWSSAERRLVPVIALAFLAWMLRSFVAPFLPEDSFTDGTIAIVMSLLLFVLPDGIGRPLLTWREANHAPWGVLLMFGGGLALAGAMSRSGLAAWLGEALLVLDGVPLVIVALALVALVVLITEFASNVATASGIMPVVAALAVALGGESDFRTVLLLAMPAAMAASWGFMLPAGTGPNAIAWATGRLTLPRLIRAGLALDLAGIALIVGVAFVVSSVTA
ncbi:SLC13 family permease [Aurantiacibacter luteus]|uniref:C4-dicarboxylate ABC transporter n=1 Tax=Aurantiacibacter luteus TaxID=1581420 RepID=A0A0G9MVY5_9SPHN|nr:DASS family sodium-coupled anion symporter [Aurantiacibacter luteus]KLE34937.1 C4-dicarboxylate ABC transporter [Aurantiacibacter luteus]